MILDNNKRDETAMLNVEVDDVGLKNYNRNVKSTFKQYYFYSTAK